VAKTAVQKTEQPEISQADLTILENYSNYFKFVWTWAFQQFVQCRHSLIALFTGNQAMKTASCAYNYVLRIHGWHPVPEKNVLYFECPDKHYFNIVTLPKDWICPQCKQEIKIHERGCRIFRFASEVLPGEKATTGDASSSAEVKNSVYPEFKKWLPPFLMKRDITFRNMAMIIADPNRGKVLCGQEYKGDDIIVEFVAYSQTVQSTAGKQRLSVWEDEEPNWDFHEEQLPRLMAEDGDLLLSLTAANRICFDIETEILTQNGWVNDNTVKTGQLALTFNTETKDYEWQPIEGMFKEYTYDDKMISLKCKGFDALVTPEHKWPIVHKINGKIERRQTKDLKTHHKIFRAAQNTIEHSQVYEDWFVELVGWFLTDGAMPTERRQIFIHQSWTANKDKCLKIKKIVSNINNVKNKHNRYINHPGEGGEGINYTWTINGKEVDLLRSLFPTRELTSEFVFSLTKKQQSLLYETLIDGDGCRSGVTDRFRCTRKTLDAFHILCILLGRKSTEESEITSHGAIVYRANIQRLNSKRYKPFTHVCSLKREYVDYKGIIWCPTVAKNNTLVAKRNGTIYITSNSWTYDEIFERAQVYIRTKAVCDFLETSDYKPEQIEYTESPNSIAVIQAATDDNPTLTKEAIENQMSQYDDPDVVATRRFGVHKQVKGRIFKGFDYSIHMIDKDTYFPYGIPHFWTHGRGIDYHPQTPWACGCMSLSSENEAVIWCDYNPSPDKLITKEICYNFALMGKDYKFILNLIDPLSEGIKKDKITVLDDINREFHELKREGIGTGAYWQTWDTKGEKGRDEIKKRLKNSRECGRPFNNKVTKDGRTIFLPTLWILNDCKTAAKMMRMWRWEEFVAEKDRIQRGEKNKAQDKWSHFNMVVEALFKNPAFRPRRERPERRVDKPKRYFQGRR